MLRCVVNHRRSNKEAQQQNYEKIPSRLFPQADANAKGYLFQVCYGPSYTHVEKLYIQSGSALISNRLLFPVCTSLRILPYFFL